MFSVTHRGQTHERESQPKTVIIRTLVTRQQVVAPPGRVGGQWGKVSSHRHQQREFLREGESETMTVKKFHVGGVEFFLPTSISGNTAKSSSKTIFCFWDDGLNYVTENAVMLVENRPAKNTCCVTMMMSMRGVRWNLCNFQNVSRLPKCQSTYRGCV